MPNDEEAMPKTLVTSFGTIPVMLSEDQMTITIGGDKHLLSPTQFQLFAFLITRQATSFAEMVEQLYQSALDPSLHQALLMHVKRLRHKLRGSPLRIYAIHSYGFILLPDPDHHDLETTSLDPAEATEAAPEGKKEAGDEVRDLEVPL